MTFWDTPAGLTALLAARSSMRLSTWRSKLEPDAQDPPWIVNERQIIVRLCTRLREQLRTESLQPDYSDVDLAADIASGRIVEDPADLDRAERAVGATFVMVAESQER